MRVSLHRDNFKILFAGFVAMIFLSIVASAGIASAAQPRSDFGLRTATPNQAACNFANPDIDDSAACAAYRVNTFVDAKYGQGVIVKPIYRVVPKYSAGVVWNPIIPCAWMTNLVNYCAPNNNVYLGLGAATAWSNSYGRFAGVDSSYAHEMGHHLLTEKHGTYVYAFQNHKNFELQEDCVGGAFGAYALTRGWANEADITNTQALNFATGDSNHGTGQERVDAYAAGLNGGLSACNNFAPAPNVF